MTVSKFKVGDRVYATFHGCGTVTKIIQDGDEAYPIEVTWDVSRYKHGKDVSTFTPDGFLWLGDKRDYTKITVVGKAAEDRHKFKSDFDGEVEMRIDALEKVEYTAVNPSHYQVEGIPEAIEIMKHLMTKEQFEGFLWGNILKYAYRYGRKGDKKETAGKIKWYAQRLEELVQ